MTTKTTGGKSPAFQFYASDFLVDTAEMSNQEVGAYIRLLAYQWVNDGITSVEHKLNRILGKELDDVWAGVEHKFELCDDNMYRNPRLERSRVELEEYKKRCSDAGKIGAAKRWHSDPNATAMRKNDSSSSSSSSKDQNTRPFHPPTVDDVNKYCRERNNSIDGKHFIDYYQAQGWLLSNGRKMKCWKSAVRNWESRDKQKQQDDVPTLKKGKYL